MVSIIGFIIAIHISFILGFMLSAILSINKQK